MSEWTKTSDRTVRKPCKRCGTTDLYWARDESGKFHLVAANAITRSVPKDGVIGNAEKYAHECGVTKNAPEPVDVATPAEAFEVVAEAEVTVAPEPEPEPEPVAPVVASDDPQAQALAALSALLAPKVSKEDIREAVAAELDGVLFPTRTVIIREKTKEPIPVDGPTHYAFAEVLEWLLCREHVLMVGPAGTGKSTIGKQAAAALGISFGAISLNPQTPKSDLFGYKDAQGTYHRTVFRDRCDSGGLFMLDEFDNGHGGIMAGLNSALANGFVAFPDGMVDLHEDFLCVAGANTDGRGAKDGYIRQRLDYATLDRFTVVHVGYDEALEAELVRATGIERKAGTKVLAAVRQARANVAAAGMDLVYSPRASLGMARGLVGGMTWEQVVTARLKRGLTEQEWTKVGASIAMAA